MNTRYYMVIIKGEIKTSEIMSCGYNRNNQKWDVKFNNGKTYSYAYLNVEKLTDPEVLNPNMYRISREGREFFDVNAIYVFRSRYESYWHICFGNGSERDYHRSELNIVESCLTQSQSSNVFEYIKQIAGLSNIRNEETGEKLLSKRFDKISFVGSDVALARYLNPSSLQGKRTGREYNPIFPFGCNNSQYKAVKSAMENQIIDCNIEEHKKNLQFSSRFFDAYLGAEMYEGEQSYYLLLGAAVYYLCGYNGSSRVLADRIPESLELNISQIDSVLSQILKGKEEVEYHFDIEMLSNVVDSYNDFQRTGTTFDFDKLIQLREFIGCNRRLSSS